MSECPDIDALVDGQLDPSGAAAAHAAGCPACRAVLALVATRAQGSSASGRSDSAACERFEALIAARAAGALAGADERALGEHLLACAGCRQAAGTAPPDTADGELPIVPADAYELGPEIARGGMGRIRAARDRRVGRAVAVKELLDRSPAGAARFAREARLTARLQHPGIVPIYEVGRWSSGRPFYAMRIVPGRTLGDAIREADTLRQRLALVPSVLAAAEAVAYAHGEGVIHRDLTPNNILLGSFGETVVIDWGLAKDLAEEPDPAPEPGETAAGDAPVTSIGAVIGTAAYMPPEQAAGAAVDRQADVYALGAIIYHLLTGAPPYRGGGAADLLGQVRAGPPAPVEAFDPAMPRYLTAIVAKAMARDPRDRYASARELAAALSQFYTGQFVRAHDYSTRALLRRWIRRHRTTILASTATFVILVLIGAATALSALRSLRRAERDRDEARAAAAAAYEERGGLALAGGDPELALAYLAEAHRLGRRTPQLERGLIDAARAARAAGPASHPAAIAAQTRERGPWRFVDGRLVRTAGAKP